MSHRYTPLFLLVLLASRVDAQTPNLSATHALPGNLTAGPSPGIQRYAAIARGGDQFLAVWSDYRANAAGTPLVPAQGAGDIFGMRLDATGSPIDAVSIPIGLALGEQPRARVAWNGANWLVVWASQEPTPFFYATKLRAARVSPSGAVLDDPPIQVLDYELFADSLFSVSSDGTNWGVVVEGTTGELRGVRISPFGAVLDPAGVQLYAGSFSLLQSVDLAFSGGEYLLAWEELVGFDWTIRARRFTPALAPIDASPKTIVTAANHVKAAGNGSGFYLVWQTSVVRGTRVNLAGTVLDPGGVNLSGTVPFGPEPQVSWDGTQWVVTWMGIGPGTPAPLSVQAARVSAAGAVLDFGGVAIDASTAGDKRDPAIAGGVVVWTDARVGGLNPEDIYAASFSPAGAAGIGIPASLSAPMQTAPRMAFNGTGYLAAFLSELSGASRVVVQRVDAKGIALDAEPIEVASGLRLLTPAVAWNGSVYLVAWHDAVQKTIFARRLAANGAPIDPAPIAVMPGSSADVAALGDRFLVVGVNAPSNPEIQYPFARRVSALDGSLLDPAPFTVGFSFTVGVQVETLADRWVVAWEEHVSHDESLASVRVNTVDAAGAPGIAVTVGTNNHAGFSRVGLASSGATALVTWENGFGTSMNVQGRLVLPGGSPTGSVLTLSAAANSQRRPAAGWDGAQYVVGYESLQNISLFFDTRTDVFATRVLESGAVLDAAGFGVFEAQAPVSDAGVSGSGFGRSLIAAAVFHPESPFAGYKLETRMMRPDGLDSYGSGTPGCSGPHHLDANGAPNAGSAGFALICDHAPPSSLGVALVTNLQDLAGSDPFGLAILFHVGLIGAAELIPLNLLSDAAGFATAPIAVPAAPTLIGTFHFAQGIFAWSGPCSPSLYSLSSSDGLVITVQP